MKKYSRIKKKSDYHYLPFDGVFCAFMETRACVLKIELCSKN